LLPSSHVTVCDVLGFIKSFFETLHENLPVAQAKQLREATRLIDEEIHFMLEGAGITQLDLFIDWPEKYFSCQSVGQISNTSGTRLVRKSSQGLFNS